MYCDLVRPRLEYWTAALNACPRSWFAYHIWLVAAVCAEANGARVVNKGEFSSHSARTVDNIDGTCSCAFLLMLLMLMVAFARLLYIARPMTRAPDGCSVGLCGVCGFAV